MAYHITCDGAYSRDREVGGWCAVVEESGYGTQKSYGQVQRTTSQRMELAAILAGLNAAKEEQHVTVYSDSQYAINIINGESTAKVNLDLVDAIFARIEEFDNSPVFTWLPRKSTPQAREADRIASLMTTLGIGIMEPSSLGSTDGIDGIDVDTPAEDKEEPTPTKEVEAAPVGTGEPPVGALAMSDVPVEEDVEEIVVKSSPRKRRRSSKK